MISLNIFKRLTIEEQVELLNEQAVSLDVYYKKSGTEVALFSLGNFYVELYVEPFTDEIIKIKSFTSIKRLDTYLGQININEIIKLLAVN
jgi:hypothetical protein